MHRRRFVLASFAFAVGIVAAVAVVAWAAEEKVHTAAAHGLAGWTPRKIENEKADKKQIEAMLEDLHAAYRDANQEAAAARMDFPVMVVTDDWKGEVIAGSWDRDTWMQRMAPLFQHPTHELQRAHSHNVFIISDSLASVDDEQSVILGKTKVRFRSSSVVIRKDRQWFIKATVEGGWGDTDIARPGQEPPVGGTGTAESTGR